jgi:hypothetical protein
MVRYCSGFSKKMATSGIEGRGEGAQVIYINIYTIRCILHIYERTMSVLDLSLLSLMLLYCIYIYMFMYI